MGLSWRCSEIWTGSRKVTLQNMALGAADICSAWSFQPCVWTKPDLCFHQFWRSWPSWWGTSGKWPTPCCESTAIWNLPCFKWCPNNAVGCLLEITPAPLTALGAPSGLGHPTLTAQQIPDTLACLILLATDIAVCPWAYVIVWQMVCALWSWAKGLSSGWMLSGVNGDKL